MISFRQADLIESMNPMVNCRIIIVHNRKGTFYYAVDPVGYGYSKVKPLQDKIDAWFRSGPPNGPANCDEVDIGWVDTDTDRNSDTKQGLIALLETDPTIKNLHIIEEDLITFGWRP